MTREKEYNIMPLNVTCPGCLTRFQVSNKFAGQKGPCPKCKTIIEIPKASVKIFGAEPLEYGGRAADGRVMYQPVEQVVPDIHPKSALWGAVSAVCVFFAACIFGQIPMYLFVRSIFGGLGLMLVSLPLSLFGELVLRDRNQLFIYTGIDLYRRTGSTAAAYCVLWFVLEWLLFLTGSMGGLSAFIFVIFACFGMLATVICLELPLDKAMMHFMVFAVPVLILRYYIGLGELWDFADVINAVANPEIPPPEIWQ